MRAVSVPAAGQGGGAGGSVGARWGSSTVTGGRLRALLLLLPGLLSQISVQQPE